MAKIQRYADVLGSESLLLVSPAALPRPAPRRAATKDGDEPKPSALLDGSGVGIAVVSVSGPLLHRSSYCDGGITYGEIERAILTALRSEDIGGVLLVIDSPGGHAAGAFEAVKRIRAARMASGKPIVAYADEMMASAAYALAMVANAGIVAPATGDVGSIGVIASYQNLGKMFEAIGVETSIWRSGKRKAELSGVEPPSPAASKEMQARVADMARQFAELVGSARGMKPAAVLKLEGACFSAADAAKHGLVDQVGGLDDAIARLLAAMEDEGMSKNRAVEDEDVEETEEETAEGDEDEETDAAEEDDEDVDAESDDEDESAEGDDDDDEEAAAEEDDEDEESDESDEEGDSEDDEEEAEEDEEKARKAKRAKAKRKAAKATAARGLEALIAQARSNRQITASEVPFWRTQGTAALRGYMRVASRKVPARAERPVPRRERAHSWEAMSTDEKLRLRTEDPQSFQALLDGHRARRQRVETPRKSAAATERWESLSVDEKKQLQAQDPKRFDALLKNYRARAAN